MNPSRHILAMATSICGPLLGGLLVLIVSAPPLVGQATPRVGATEDVLTSLPIDRIRLPLGRSGQMMELAVYLPHNYDPSEIYPLLVIPDADPLMGLLQSVSFLWAEEGTAYGAILVGLPFGDNAGAIWTNRSYYLLPDSVGVVEYYDIQLPLHNGGGAAELARFLKDQVLPTVQERYSVDPTRLGLAGFSAGGLFAAWHLVTHPGIFSDYLILAPPLAPPMIDDDFNRASERVLSGAFDRSTNVYVSYAEHDLTAVIEGASRWIEAWERVDDANLSFRSESFPGLRHDGGAIPGLINGYKFLYGR